MIDERQVRDMLERRAGTISATPTDEAKAIRRARRRLALNATVGGFVGLVLVAGALAGLRTIRSAPIPADDPPSTSKLDACTTAPSPQPASTIEGPFGQVGGWIAYSSGDGICALDPARPERRIRLSRGDGDPIAWSSDGTKLLIHRGGGLVVLEADGTETRLTDGVARGGSFSPDGSEVVYATPKKPPGSAIYAVSSDGGAPRLIRRATRRVLGGRVLAGMEHTVLSPDGTRIAYIDGIGDNSHNLWVMNADGTERRLLLDEDEGPGFGAGHVDGLTWSPDGEWLAFTGEDGIYLVRPDGSGLTRLVPGSFFGEGPVQWSPDGSRIAYRRHDVLWIGNVDGSNERIVEGIGEGSIAWNPAV
jgi:Tol biopolymer transport system component